jgi:hypothetical protein
LLEVVQPKVYVRTRVALLARFAGPWLGAVESLIARHWNFQDRRQTTWHFHCEICEVTCSSDPGDFVFLLAA